MNQQQQQTPKSSSPEYRSVAMASPAMPPPMLRSPFFSHAHESSSLKHVSLNPTTKTTTTTLVVPPNKPWTLSQSLPLVPAGYMLERNQIHIHTSSPQEIANRISECLNLRSFVIKETKDSEIKNAFRAESCKGVLFRVNFFQDSSLSNELIVEFQRLAGCSYEFQRTFQAVHRHVCQQQDEETKQELEFPTCCVAYDNSHNKSERLLDTFRIAMDMIENSKRLDSQLMGLEILEPMSTNPEIVSLLFSEHIQTLLNFCKGMSSEQSSTLSQLAQQQDCLLKRRALSVLANALESSSTNNNNNDADQQVLKTLLACLESQQPQDPHQSFQVARCLVVLLSKANSDNSQQALAVQQSQAIMALLANNRTQHLALEQEYQKLESILRISS